MRWLTPREVDGKWRYASVSRRGGGPIGFCAEDGGHASEHEARECYTKYLRSKLRLDGTCSWTTCSAKDCKQPANQVAEVFGHLSLAPLCPEHLNEDTAVRVLRLDLPAGDSWVS